MHGKNNCNLDNEFPIDDSILWIDPLDGTLAYTKNELEAVTVLMGVSHKKSPLLGIIAHIYPRKSIEENRKCDYDFDPQIYFAHAN